MRRHETEPFAFGLLAALFYLLFITIACNSCAHMPPPPTTQPITEPQNSRTVRIDVKCVATDGSGQYASGSGVVLGGRKVLTANHVVECAGTLTAHVVFEDKRSVGAVVERLWPDRDIAKLLIENTGLPDLVISSPKIGDKVCVAAAAPERRQACGQLQFTYDKPYCEETKRGGHWCYDLGVVAPVIPGNSGSGVYASDGSMMALATGTTSAFGIVFPMGYLSSLYAIRQELLK